MSDVHFDRTAESLGKLSGKVDQLELSLGAKVAAIHRTLPESIPYNIFHKSLVFELQQNIKEELRRGWSEIDRRFNQLERRIDRLEEQAIKNR